MSIQGIDEVTYGVTDLALCTRYFQEWGLRTVSEDAEEVALACLNGCRVRLVDAGNPDLAPAIESGSTLREVVWGVESDQDLERIAKALARHAPVRTAKSRIFTTDPNGLSVGFQVSVKHPLSIAPTLYNGYGSVPRTNVRAPMYPQAAPVEISHVVFYTENLAAIEEWYVKSLGFHVSDSYPGRGLFMRCSEAGGHHDAFFLQLPNVKRGLNHVAFTVRDIHEVFGGGVHFSRLGWQTEIGPGRHPISSGYFWYFKCPAGGASEYSADEDFCTSEWVPREFAPAPENYAEWAAMGDVDMRSRKRNAAATSTDATPEGARTARS